MIIKKEQYQFPCLFPSKDIYLLPDFFFLSRFNIQVEVVGKFSTTFDPDM